MATFGKTDQGGSYIDVVNYIYGSKFTLAENGTVTSIHVYCNAIGGSYNIKVGLYADDGGSPATSALETEGVGAVPTWGGWLEIDVPDVLLSAGDYWLLWNTDNDAARVYYDGVGSGVYTSYAYADSMPDPHPAIGGTQTREFSIYATYTPGGGGGPTSDSKIQVI